MKQDTASTPHKSSSLSDEMELLVFTPIFKETIWGGSQLTGQKGIGESWLVSGVKGSESVVASGKFAGKTLTELLQLYGADLVGDYVYQRFGDTFPILVKLIDADDDLSIQVHPDDETALRTDNQLGKSEMWYILNATPTAQLTVGFKHAVTRDTYQHHVDNGTVDTLLQKHPVKRGDAFYLPAGRIHAIGKGIFLAEVQETSDLTYRVFDYNRRDANGQLRQLHTEAAAEVINYNDSGVSPLTTCHSDCNNCTLVNSEHFTVRLLQYTANGEGETLIYRDGGFVIFVVLEGECDINNTPLPTYSAIFLPAKVCEHPVILHSKNNNITLLEITLTPQ